VKLGLEERIAIVTGGSEGVGKATALALAREGARVAVIARRPDVLQRAADEIGAAIAVPGDVTVLADLERAVSTVLDTLGPPTILINNAGVTAHAAFDEVSDSAWQADLDLKLTAAIRLTRLVLPHMRAEHDGRIVNVTAVIGKTLPPATAPTSVSRAAGLALTKVLSKELASDGIRVNAVCIGLVKSAQIARAAQRRFPALTRDEAYARMAATIPLGRIGETTEAANVITFLASDAAAYVTGVAVNIDGGMSEVF
jgi:NAD(P)-dependent dehydrogenase (short-subunit alcohol dehydrogenase family)